jgi:hypothetical protein
MSISAQKSFLRGVFSFPPIVQHTIREVKRIALVELNEFSKSLWIACQGSLHPQDVIFLAHDMCPYLVVLMSCPYYEHYTQISQAELRVPMITDVSPAA